MDNYNIHTRARRETEKRRRRRRKNDIYLHSFHCILHLLYGRAKQNVVCAGRLRVRRTVIEGPRLRSFDRTLSSAPFALEISVQLSSLFGVCRCSHLAHHLSLVLYKPGSSNIRTLFALLLRVSPCPSFFLSPSLSLSLSPLINFLHSTFSYAISMA